MKTLALTGGAQGIGRAVALHFAEAGYAVSFADPMEDAGAELEAMLRDRGAEALYTPADISRADEVAAWMDATCVTLGVPDVLINNAGIMTDTPLLDLAPEDFDRVIAVNLRGTFLCAQEAARRMIAGTIRGAIVNMASTRAYMSEPGTEAYSASKGGIVALTHALAMSLAPHNIRVNAVAPGWIEVADWQGAGRATRPHHSIADRAQHPVGRVGTPLDVAEACLFLAEKASFMTGQTITLDGGMSVKMIYEE